MIVYLGFYRACLFADAIRQKTQKGNSVFFIVLCSNLGVFKVLKSKSGYFLWFSKKKIPMSIPVTSTLGVSPPWDFLFS